MISTVKWVPRSELTLEGSPNLEKDWEGREALYPLCEYVDHGEEVFVTPC